MLEEQKAKVEARQQATELAVKWPMWMNLKESAKYCNVAIGKFKRYLVATGKVKPTVTDFGKRYNRADIDQAIKEWY